jgi:L-alanine-DL-glutamate epimerase-like enolase superfamily enzyme
MSRVERVDVFSVAVPTHQRLSNSQKQFSEYHFVIARVWTDAACGWGWAYTQGVGGDLVGRVASKLMGPTVVGRDPAQRTALWREWATQAYSLGMTGVLRLGCAVLDIALWDVWARETGRSLTDALGGAVKPTVPAYYSHLNLWQDDDALEDEARTALGGGFTQWKMKVGRIQLQEDLERIRRVKALGLEVMVDANQNFLKDEAVRRAYAYRDAGAWFVEEPVRATDWDGYRAVSQIAQLTVAGGESLYQPEWFEVLAQTGVHVLQPDIFRIGGLTPLVSLMAVAEARRWPLMLHCGEELATPVAMAFDLVGMVEHLPAIGLYELGLIKDPLPASGGTLRPLQGPGHGVIFDEKTLGELRHIE